MFKSFTGWAHQNFAANSHITAVRRKLNYASATLYRIRDSLPKHLHKDLYHTLFESHLTYCISVWGGSAMNRIARLWISQKHCVRVLFGDKEAFLDKFRTAVGARPYKNQLLGEEFYCQEFLFYCKLASSLIPIITISIPINTIF